VEQYELLWSPFTSDMERKFGFERQPLAAQVYRALKQSSCPHTFGPLVAGGEDADGKTMVCSCPPAHSSPPSCILPQVNVMTLARALLPLVASGEDADGKMIVDDSVAKKMQAIVSDEYKTMSAAAQGEARRAKMGLATWDEQTSAELYSDLQQLMARSQVDFTIFWRQLSHVTDADLKVWLIAP
jgi:hypothetical protein